MNSVNKLYTAFLTRRMMKSHLKREQIIAILRNIESFIELNKIIHKPKRD